MTDKIEVTQADRDAAADYLELLAPTMPNIHAEASKRETALSRAFARHAHAARIEGARAAIEAAAIACEEASSNAFANGYSEAAEGIGDAAEIVRALDPEQIVKGMSQ